MATLINLLSDFPKQIFDSAKMFLELEPFKTLMRHIETALFITLLPIAFAAFIKIRKIWKNRNK